MFEVTCSGRLFLLISCFALPQATVRPRRRRPAGARHPQEDLLSAGRRSRPGASPRREA